MVSCKRKSLISAPLISEVDCIMNESFPFQVLAKAFMIGSREEGRTKLKFLNFRADNLVF